MNILMINKYYYNFGGAENYMFSLSKLLTDRGHKVIPFSMKHPKNYSSDYSKYFVEEIDYNNASAADKFKSGLKSIYSNEARNNLSKLLDEQTVDIAHLHNYNFQLTPSILFELKKRNIPVVNTLHDPQIICPHHRLFNYQQMAICEKCNGLKFYNAFLTKCIKNSYTKSFLGTIESYVYHWSKIYEKIDLFISPSNFLMGKIIEFGMKNINIKMIPNFYNEEIISKEREYSNEVIYIGRISEEKGLATLIDAFRNLKELNLKIIGDGPEKQKLENAVKTNNLNNIQFLGHLSQEEIKSHLQKSLFLVVPSEWYENCPLTVLEAMANSKAVLGSRLGGIVDLVEENRTGLLFKAGDEKDLKEKIEYMAAHKEDVIRMGKCAGKLAKEKYTPEKHIKLIENEYKEIISKYRLS